MSSNFVLKQQDNGIMILTLSRPERRNALGTEMISGLVDALREADTDSSIGSVIITGAAPAFCAGSDLKELAGLSPRQMRDHEAATATLARSIALIDRPVMAAVEGYALGGGFILATACDVIVAARDARWHLPEVANGWLPPWGLGSLIARSGPVAARRITWGLAPLDGSEAERLGVVDVLTEPGAALARAVELSANLCSLPRAAVSDVKRFYRQFVARGAEYLDAEAGRAFEAAVGSEAARTLFARFTVTR